ncbi:FAD-dependent monooxygenase andE like protein [Verticillium longisporum]|nr:FAD-dependent monooxygenase andE like protein [Verticillium longisporum]
MLCNDTEGSCYGVFDSTWFEVGTIAFIIFFVFNYNMASKSQSGFRVLVAGGGIAGLTLANCLERAGVEYILLEAHDNVAPRTNWDATTRSSRKLKAYGSPDVLIKMATFFIFPTESVFWKQGKKLLFNYAISYLERETVLRVLYENLHDKSPIHLLRRITSVDHSGTDGVVVHCQDGTIVAGDVLVGCDGVNSLVRREMWRLSEHGKPQATPVSVRHDLKADFQCLFGLSTRTRGVNAGEMDVNFASGFSTMVIGGKDGRVFWFVFAKMDKTYTSPNIPKYSYQDAVEFANEYMDFTIKDGLKFSDLWQSRTSVTLAATEEAELKEWTWGRIACVGDNVHKMTPHMGAGGNAAMEPIAFFYCLQSFKIVHVMGVYCFAHYVQSPIENFRAKDMRLTNRAYSGTVLVTLLVAYYVPLVTAIMPVFSITTRLTWGYIFQYFPFSISILQNGLKHLFLEDVMDEDKIWAPNGDLSLIGLTIFTFALFAFAARLLALIDTLTSQVLSQSSDMVLMTELGGWAQPIRLFEIHAIFAVLLVWLLYLFSDLKRAEIVRWSWPTLLVCIATALCLFGPGVTVGMGWLVRERLLATRSHKDAIVDTRLREKALKIFK